jgi:small conductance mechanosensitive channel
METHRLRRARPHLLRALIAGILALAGMVVARFGQLLDEGKPNSPNFDAATTAERTLAIAGAAVLLVLGMVAVRAMARSVREAMEARAGDGRGAPLGVVVSAFGYLILALAVLSALGVELEAFLLGGALTGVIIGIAAQQTLGNFFAGIVLLAVRPFSIGEKIVLRSGPLGGEYEGRVVSMSLFYVGLITERGPVQLPNAGVLSAAVGPGARSANKDEIELED